MPDQGASVRKESFLPNAVPAVNLFERRFDRILMTTRDVEHYVTPVRTAPLDYEVFAINSVTGSAHRAKMTCSSGRSFGNRHHVGGVGSSGLLHDSPPDAATE